jgi:hypothetical protein
VIVVSFDSYLPPPRYDGIPWFDARIEEAPAEAGPWTQIDDVLLTPPDPDPANPIARSFTTENATAEQLWYRVIFADENGDTAQPTWPQQNAAGRAPYATVEELASILHISNPQPPRRTSLERVLAAAANEIDAELGRATPFDSPPELVVQVNLERAVEHWNQAQSPFGLIGVQGESLPAFAREDTWRRHAHKLAPLKTSWGIA